MFLKHKVLKTKIQSRNLEWKDFFYSTRWGFRSSFSDYGGVHLILQRLRWSSSKWKRRTTYPTTPGHPRRLVRSTIKKLRQVRPYTLVFPWSLIFSRKEGREGELTVPGLVRCRWRQSPTGSPTSGPWPISDTWWPKLLDWEPNKQISVIKYFTIILLDRGLYLRFFRTLLNRKSTFYKCHKYWESPSLPPFIFLFSFKKFLSLLSPIDIYWKI